MANASIIGNFKSFADYQGQEQKNALAQALTMAQIEKASKPDPFDVTKVGQAALVKKQMGLPTTPQEDASAQVYTAITQSIGTDFQGNTFMKPGVGDRLGGAPSATPQVNPAGNFATNMKPVAPGAGGGGDFLNDVAPVNNIQIEIPKDLQAPIMGTSQNRVYTADIIPQGGAAPVNAVPQKDPLEQEIANEANRQRAAAGNSQKMLMEIDKSENDARLKLITEKQNKAQIGAEKYSKQIESTGLSELVGAAERASNAVAGSGDIKGYSKYQPSWLPDIAVPDDGVSTRQEIAGLKNAILKARSGGAVTPSEAQRMLNELGVGLGRSDTQLRKGISNVTSMINEKLQNAAAGYTKEAKDFYIQQGGTITPDRLQKFVKLTPMDKRPDKASFDAKKPPKSDGATIQIKNDSDYNALPSGSKYVAPDGTVRTKK